MQSEAITQFSAWVAATPMSKVIGTYFWIVPSTQSVHYMALAVLFSSAAIIDLRILGLVAGHTPLTRIAQRFIPGIWIALVVMTLTGVILLIGEPARSLTTWEFQSKMAMLAVVIVLTLFLQRRLADPSVDVAPGRDGTAALPASARLAAVASLVLWMLIIVAGRWIAYHS
jgi:hypothetical protein